jgi:hypothetical protein
MRKIIGLLLLTFAVQPMLAKDNWPLTITVLSTKNIEDPHGSFHLSWFSSNAGWSQSSGRAGWSHRIAEHSFVEANNGNSYELQPKNPKDMLLPGTYQAKIEKRDMMVCEPKDNGNCREVRFFVVGAVQTAQATETTPKAAELAPAPTTVAPSPAPSTPALALTATQALLSIESTPSGADIEIDGAFVGNTPSTVNVGPGSHQIAVKKEGFANWTKALNVTSGTVHLNAELKQEQPKQ